MLKRTEKIIRFLIFVLLFSSCRTAMVPVSYSFNAVNVKSGISGSWIDVTGQLPEGSAIEQTISGELIAIQNDSLYVLTSVTLTSISIKAVNKAILYVFKNRTARFAAITSLVFIPNIIGTSIDGNFGFLLLGFPWLVAGTALTIVEGINNSSHLIYPERNRIDELRDFARYPIGIPSGIDKNRLHLVSPSSQKQIMY